MPDKHSHNATKLAEQIAQSFQANDLQKALSLCQQLNQQYDTFHHGWYLASVLMSRVHNHKDALLAIEKAISLYLSDKYTLQKLQCHIAKGNTTLAKQLCEQWQDATFTDANLHHQLGDIYNGFSLYQQALSEFEKAIVLDSSNAVLYFNKGTIQRYLGDMPGAKISYDKAIALNPADYESYASRSNLERQTPGSNNVEQLKSVIAHVSKVNDNSLPVPNVYYALAKELEDIGQYDESFKILQQGSERKRRQMQYSIKTDIDIIDAITQVYSANIFDGSIKGCERDDAIFILGMPRTGTTLVERILSSHSAVSSAGELNNFSLEMMAQVKEKGLSPSSRLNLIEKTTTLDFEKLGQRYLESVVSARDNKPHFIDKLPFNYLYVGLIHLALPNAKIINLQRHPMASCYSVYKQLFKDAYPFSYNLPELAQYYVAYHRLMDHWNTVLPGIIHTVAYEDVVADTEGQAKELVDHCGLEWQQQCIRFHENQQASTTASAAQVRRPVYNSSLNQWRHYYQYLQPVKSILQQAGINTD